MTCFTSFVPKKFLWKYPLQLGAKIVGAVMCITMTACTLALIVECISYPDSDNCGFRTVHNATAFRVNAILYCVAMLAVNLWFLWGVKYEKSSVVLSWVVITSMWWFQTVCFVAVLIFLYSKLVSLVSWVVALAFGVLAFIILLYGIFVGFGYWLELKGIRSNNT